MQENVNGEANENFSIYVSQIKNCVGLNENSTFTETSINGLLRSCSLLGKYCIQKTSCGFVVSFKNQSDADLVLTSHMPDLHVVKLNKKVSKVNQAVFLREVPWAIQINDLKDALTQQGVTLAKVERKRHHVRVEGFWHIASNCRHEVRCVRCGDHHSVQVCPRPRSDPICCHCSGPHHAAFKYCPVRLDLANAIPVSLTLSTARSPSPRRY